MDDLRELGRTILLSANLKHRGADLLDHFRKTGEIRTAAWFPELEGESLRLAFEVAKRSVEKMIEDRIAESGDPVEFGDEQPQGHDFAPHRTDHRLVH